MAVTAGPTMALWVLAPATWLTNLGSLVASASVAETILSHAPPGRSGAVASVQPAFGMTGYALGPAVYLLLFKLFFRRQWLNDPDARGLSETQAAQAVDATRSAVAHAVAAGRPRAARAQGDPTDGRGRPWGGAVRGPVAFGCRSGAARRTGTPRLRRPSRSRRPVAAVLASAGSVRYRPPGDLVRAARAGLP
ncbi:hypothetical protein [Kitasatospora sp. NPDC001132]